jgi:asparaginyl-tRNA synthetase
MQVSQDEEHFAKVLGSCEQGEYPLIKSKDKMKLETLRDICHLRPRTNTISCVARIRNSLAYATHLFFQSRGFFYVHTPIITSADCEGAGEMFQVTTVLPKPSEKGQVPLTKEGLIDYKNDFFAKPSFLTVSGQLAVENFACALSDVYTFGPTFRAEVSHTTRHLAEFWMIEPEMCFADIYDDMECAESYLKYCLKYVIENNADDLAFMDAQVEKGIVDRLKNVIDNDFKRVSYTEAIGILKEAVAKDKKLFQEEKKKKEKKEKKKDAKEGEAKDATATVDTITVDSTASTETKPEEKKKEEKLDKRNIFWGMDMASDHERYLTEVVFKQPIIVYNYPKEIKSFYMRQNEDGKTVAAMDILVPKIGEIIGGSQREERLENLEKRLAELGMDKKHIWWYLELRKFGSVPHAGFGLGFERLVMMATGLENIRDVIPYPRYPGHAEF